jgi:arylsulfatase A
MILTHDPFEATPDCPDYLQPQSAKSNGSAGRYPEMVAYADKLIGKLIAKLDELKLRDNTLVLILGDNGTPRGVTSRFKGRDVIGGKISTTVWGTHVPCIGNWPGHIAGGKVCEDLIGAVDVLPTLCEAAGATVPAEWKADGRSFLPQLRGEKGNPREWLYTWYHPDGGAKARAEFAHDGTYKLYTDGRFFNMKQDDLEKSPLAAETLDDTAKAAKLKLEAALKQFEGPRPEYFVEQAESKILAEKSVNNGSGLSDTNQPANKKADRKKK